MRSMGFGYEGSVNSNTVLATSTPFPNDIIVRGIQVKLSGVILHTPSIAFGGQYNENTHFEVLWTVTLTGQPDSGITTSSLTDTIAGQVKAGADHGGIGNAGSLVQSIVKKWITVPPIDTDVEDSVVIMGMDIPAKKGDQLILRISHDGYPGDAEMQGVLFYDDAP